MQLSSSSTTWPRSVSFYRTDFNKGHVEVIGEKLDQQKVITYEELDLRVQPLYMATVFRSPLDDILRLTSFCIAYMVLYALQGIRP